MKHTYLRPDNQRCSRERSREQCSRRNGDIRSRSPMGTNRQRHASNSRDRRQIDYRRQVDTRAPSYPHDERRMWNDPRSYASSSSSDQECMKRQYEREINEGNSYEGRYESDENYTDTRIFDGNSRRQNNPHSPVICKFYNNEWECSRGNSCMYLHLCRHYIMDSCKFGRICKRSHNTRDRQPMQILKQYGMAADRYSSEYVVRFIKEYIKNGKFKRDTISKTNLNRPLLQPVSINELDNVSEAASLYGSEQDSNSQTYRAGVNDDSFEERGIALDLDASNVRQNDGPDYASQSELDTSADYIALTRKRKRKQKHLDKCRKMKVHGGDKKKKKKKKKDESQHNIGGQMIQDQSTMKFELQSGNQHFQVRNVTGRFQIAAMTGPWNDMNITDSEIFSQLYQSAVQIGQRFLPKS